MRVAVAAGLTLVAVLLWPVGRRHGDQAMIARGVTGRDRWRSAGGWGDGPLEAATGRARHWQLDGWGPERVGSLGPRRWVGPLRRGRAVGAARRAEAAAVLDLLDALGPALRSGLSPAAALGCLDRPVDMASRGTLVTELSAAAATGKSLAPVWAARAEQQASPELRLVAAAWSLSESLGAPLADAAALAADLLRQRQERQRRLAVALAGPRATVVVLTLLPLGGPALALLLGLSPVELYANPPAVASVLLGLALLLLGRSWCSRMVRRLEAPRAVRKTP